MCVVDFFFFNKFNKASVLSVSMSFHLGRSAVVLQVCGITLTSGNLTPQVNDMYF